MRKIYGSIGFMAGLMALIVVSCASTAPYYRMKLKSGDEFTGTLETNVRIETAKGAILDIPANNIDEMKFGRERRVEVELRDGNEIKGKILNGKLSFRLSATGKLEEISVDKMKTFEQE